MAKAASRSRTPTKRASTPAKKTKHPAQDDTNPSHPAEDDTNPSLPADDPPVASSEKAVKESARVPPLSVFLVIMALFIAMVVGASSNFAVDDGRPHASPLNACLTATKKHPVFNPLLSPKARLGNAFVVPLHIRTSQTPRTVEQWAAKAMASCGHVHLVTERIETVEAWRDYLLSVQDRDGPFIVVLPFVMASAYVIDSFKEIAETSTLRSVPIIRRAGARGAVWLVTEGDREWLLEQVQHRTVHVMSTVELSF